MKDENLLRFILVLHDTPDEYKWRVILWSPSER